ncbi:hypothetical protein [Paraburkholderia xenovorans]|uniref:hypothetical protein n=1 Tax=Paraburkholderia xenovorans TaxID=36873 RepID=UPI0038B8F4AF
MARTIQAVQPMDLSQKEGLVDEIFHVQPHMLGSILGLQKLGVSLQKMEFVFEMLLICFPGDERVRPRMAADYGRRAGSPVADLRQHRQTGRKPE